MTCILLRLRLPQPNVLEIKHVVGFLSSLFFHRWVVTRVARLCQPLCTGPSVTVVQMFPVVAECEKGRCARSSPGFLARRREECDRWVYSKHLRTFQGIRNRFPKSLCCFTSPESLLRILVVPILTTLGVVCLLKLSHSGESIEVHYCDFTSHFSDD